MGRGVGAMREPRQRQSQNTNTGAVAPTSTFRSFFIRPYPPPTQQAGIDWAPLRDALASGDYRAADDVHRAKLIELAGPNAVSRGWVYFSEVAAMPATDLRVMDALWRAASAGKFGFSSQRAIYRAQGKRWDRFFKAIDWTVGDDGIYRKWPAEFKYTPDAAAGHLPLTNALRGTQLFEAILEHPAWDQPPQGVSGDAAAGKSGPAWLK